VLPLILLRTTETVFKEKRGVRHPMPELIITHKSQLRSQLYNLTTKGKGWSREDLSYWLSNKHMRMCAKFQKQQMRKGKDGGGKS
jgi:hypothetical protein